MSGEPHKLFRCLFSFPLALPAPMLSFTLYVPMGSSALGQQAREVLSGQRSGREVGPATEADPRLRAAYLAATAGSRARTATPAASTADAPARPQRPIEGDCPICFDELAVRSLMQMAYQAFCT